MVPELTTARGEKIKIAVLATAAVITSESDPEPDLPACFRDRNYVEKLVRGLGGQSAMSPPDPQLESRPVTLPMATDKEDRGGQGDGSLFQGRTRGRGADKGTGGQGDGSLFQAMEPYYGPAA
jgi:hypothetical protein